MPFRSIMDRARDGDRLEAMNLTPAQAAGLAAGTHVVEVAEMKTARALEIVMATVKMDRETQRIMTENLAAWRRLAAAQKEG